MNVKIGIVGASGYGGGELVRILAGHPGVEIAYLSSEMYKGREIGTAFPSLRGAIRTLCEGYDPPAIIDRCDIAFLAQHPGWAVNEAGKFLDAGKKVIDLSADFRLRDPALYPAWYKFTHTAPQLLPKAVFGLTELYREQIKGAQLLANPGCYVTGALLALSPLVKHGLVEPGKSVV